MFIERHFYCRANSFSYVLLAGLPDPAMNARLRLAVNNAKSESLPKDVIERAIKKAVRRRRRVL